MQKKALFWLFVYGVVFIIATNLSIPIEGVFGNIMQFFGVILMLYALALIVIAGKTLKKYAHSKLRKSFIPDKLTNKGIYACMRHPMHLGIGLLPLALALFSANLIAILASFLALLAAFGFVLLIEEPELLSAYKEGYFSYMQKVPPFSLSLKCLEKGLLALQNRAYIQENSKVALKGFEAKYYDRLIDFITFGWYKDFIKQVIKDLGLKKGDFIADFGAGTGRNALLMRQYIGKEGKIVGFEIGKEMQEQFLQKTKNFDNIFLEPSSILEELKQEGVFDLVFLSFVFHGFEQKNREKIINNAKKLLKKGGVLAILDFNEFDIDAAPFYVRLPILFLECPLAQDFIERDLKKMLRAQDFGEFEQKSYFKGFLRLLKAKKL